MKIQIVTTVMFLSLSSAVTFAEDANADAGKKIFKKCSSCHSLEEGINKVGPSLYNIVGATAASDGKFKYSKAMRESGVIWTDENLSAFLTKPKKFMKGTKMSFAGIKKPEQLADLIAYLKTAK